MTTEGKKAARVGIIVTSADKLGDHATGLWLEECATPYYIFSDEGCEVSILSPLGGAVPIDAGSLAGDFYTAEAKKFKEEDEKAWDTLQNSIKLDPATVVADFDALFFCGGHGTATDFISNGGEKTNPALAVEAMVAAKKLVGLVCHGPIVLAECTTTDGKPLMEGVLCTGFSNTEEVAVGLAEKVPYLLQSRLKEQGANYEKGNDWEAHAVRDKETNIITGQNPQSSEATARLLLSVLGE